MTSLEIGTIDVYVLARVGDAWEVLVLQRAHDTRCPTAWETVHGHIEPGEEPEAAAVRELREETGLEIERLYDAGVQPFYLHRTRTVQLSVGFAAVVRRDAPLVLGPEHMRAEWLAPDAAVGRLVWPRERSGLRDALHLLAGGDAGPVEDVLRVR